MLGAPAEEELSPLVEKVIQQIAEGVQLDEDIEDAVIIREDEGFGTTNYLLIAALLALILFFILYRRTSKKEKQVKPSEPSEEEKQDEEDKKKKEEEEGEALDRERQLLGSLKKEEKDLHDLITEKVSLAKQLEHLVYVLRGKK